jgi:hypothetical protein
MLSWPVRAGACLARVSSVRAGGTWQAGGAISAANSDALRPACCCRWSRGAQPSGASAAAGAEGTTGASSAAGGHAGGCDVSADEFWSSPACMALYQRYARDVLGRVNTLTGVAYKWVD